MRNDTTLALRPALLPDGADLRTKILAFEQVLGQLPGAVFGDSAAMPLTHTFADGVYVRQIFIPKGTVLTGKIHRYAHPNFLLQGEVIVVTEGGGREHLRAPLALISPAGTKRVVVALEDTVWVTVHVTTETDLARIEAAIIAPDYAALATPTSRPSLALEGDSP